MSYWKEKDSDGVAAVEGMHDGDGAIKIHDFFGDESRLPIRFQLWELDPGVSEGGHVHSGKDALEEIYYFLEGSGVMWVDGEDVPIKAGDAIMIPPGPDHGFRNTGDGPLKLVIIWGRSTGGRR